MKSETIPHDCSDCNHSCRQIGPIILVSVCMLVLILVKLTPNIIR